MTVKDEVLKIFEENRGLFYSGEEIAEKLKVSRNAVWKAVKNLQNEGYSIEAITNKGYSMAVDTDIVSIQSIEKYLKTKLDIEMFKVLPSTNDSAREMAENGSQEGKVVIALEQTKGRGRLNRKFYSPSGTGVYFSVILKPKFELQFAPFITTACAVSVVEAIESVAHKNAKIKWVNDIYIDNKKCCGILTEAKLNVETASFDYVVLGIGINVLKPKTDFDESIKNIATSVFDESEYSADKKSLLVAKVLDNFFEYYKNIEKKEFVKKYIDKSCVIGRNVLVLQGDTQVNAKVLDIDNDCRLIVETENGERKIYNSGEISLKI